MNIAYITDGLGYGGKQRQLSEFVKYFSVNQHKVFVYYFNEKEGFLPIVKQIAHKVIRIPRAKKKSLYPFLFLQQSFKKNRLDLIHTFDSMSTFYSIIAAKSQNIPIIDGSIRDAGIEKKGEYLFKRINLKLTDAIVANSKAGLAYYKINNGYFIYNAVDLSRFTKASLNTSNIIMVASFTDYKDHNLFMNASKKLIKHKVIKYSYLVGDGPNLLKYKALVKSWNLQNNIVFLGARDDVEVVLGKSTVGVLCSTKKYSEGVSNSILEYMASGLISIGPELGGVPEIIVHGKNGFLYEVENIDSLVTQIINCFELKQSWPQIVKNAEKTIEKKFSFERNMKRLLNIYREITHAKS